MKCTGIVLVGRAVSETKPPKGLFMMKLRPLVAWTVEALSKVCDEVLVACPPESAAAVRAVLPKRVRVVEDEFLGVGYLGGLHAALKLASYPWVALAPSEAPLTSPALYRLLLGELKGHDGAVPFQNDNPEPLHGVFKRKALLAAVETEMLHGIGGLREALPDMNIRKVGPRKLEAADPQKRSFWRLESPEAIRAVEGMLK